MNFNLAAPKMLWLVPLVVPPLILFLVWAWRKRQELVTQFISARLLSSLKIGVSPSRQKMRMALLVAAITCLTLSLSRPQWGYSWEEARQRGLDIIVAIDTSNSMLAEDVPPSRLARAKLAALDLMRHAKTDRLGLIAFAGDAFLTCPLTLDDAAFGSSVESLDTRTISQGGTAVAEAIETARQAFKEQNENHKALVLFTDGEDHDGGAVKAAEAAAKEGMRIYTVGIGSAEGETLRIHDEHGRTDYIRDQDGNPVKSKLNEALLEEIASAAGGFYLPLRGTKTMDTLYDHPRGLGSIPKGESTSRLLRQYHERYHWLVAIAIFLLLGEMFLPDRKLRRARIANAGASLAQAGEAAITALLLMALLPGNASGGPSTALREYEQGRYQDALKEYQQMETKKDDPRIHFNAGAAAYQGRQLEEAAKQFNDALSSPDLQLQQRAYYNLGNTYYRLGQSPPPGANAAAPGAPDLEAAKKNWEQALKHYESALKLNPQDEDAKFNHSFVQRQLEELKKQQQQQQQQDQNKDKNNSDDKKNQDKNQQSQNNSQQNQDKQQQQQQQDQQSQQNQASKGNDQKQDGQKQDQDKKQADDKNSEQKKSQAQQQQQQDAQKNDQAKNQPDDQAKEEAAREAAMMAAGQMTPQQAQQLLDAQKGDDQVLKLAPQEKHNNSSRSFKNW